MQDLLNTLQQIKDQAGPTLTHSVYERHPFMVVLDVVTVLMAIGVLIAIVVSLFGKWNLPTIVLIGVIAEIAVVGYLHSAYKYEMTKESEQRVHEALMEMSADEYTQLVNQVKLADLNQIDDVMMRLIAKHVKDINTPRLRYR